MSLLYSQANISRQGLSELVTPPALGAFHQPYGFGQYVDDIEESLDIAGLQVANQEFEVTHEGNRLFGVLEVEPKAGELITAEEWKLLVGLRGSHDQRIPRGLTLGSQVLVCSNLCFSGSLGTVNTKQTTNIGLRLPHLIRDAVNRIPELAERQEKRFDAYKHLELSPRVGDAALTELFRRGALSAPQLGRAIKEWDEPSYIEHTHADAGATTRSGWRLFNAVTEVQKPTGNNHNPDLVRQRTEIASTFLDECVGLAA